jgi:hypothetical protein
MAARHALSLATAVIPEAADRIAEAIRQLRVARESAVKSRSVAMLQRSEISLPLASIGTSQPGSWINCGTGPPFAIPPVGGGQG